jgi:hypothetical protein
MRHLTRHACGIVVVASMAVFAPALAFAGGPLDICRTGEPFRWPNNGANIPWNPDQGLLGPLSNLQATALVAEAFNRWDTIPTASTSYLAGAALPVNVTVANFIPFLFPSAPDGLSAIVYDDTGEIFDLLFGPGSGILGFAGPEWLDPSSCAIVEGVSFLNGAAIADETDVQSALDIMVHEFGHYQNLAHSVVNGQIFLGDNTGPTPFDTFSFDDLIAVLDSALETMYPFYFGPGFGFATPHKDDIAALSSLYPAPSFATSTGAITGRILASNRRTPKTGINVIARNIADPYLDAVSAISSDYTDVFTRGAPLVGVYTLRGLTPGAQYAIYVDGILEGGFSTPPGVLPGPEEFYSGNAEHRNSAKDPPHEFATVTVDAGAIRAGIDIIFNRFEPSESLPLQDDSSFELALPFAFRMCGTVYDEVIVNANGTISFGGPNADFTESAAEFLAGPPQIAGAWDDLNPLAGGSVFFTESPLHFTITFEGVPERTGPFTGVGSNTFSITLRRFISQIEIEFGGLTMPDGLAGVSCGGAITSGFEPPIDLSQQAGDWGINLLFVPAVYERFTPPGTTNDLSNLTLRFTPTSSYGDFWAEKNNNLKKATPIELPFDSLSVSQYTEIGREGDVDFYHFHARAGEVIVAEVLSSQLDTVMGFYDRKTRQLLALDDDSGVGTLSRIEIEIPTDGDYAVAVATFPDFAFRGDGSGTGRYVLRVTTAASLAEPGSQ